jgi:hypothetical protein
MRLLIAIMTLTSMTAFGQKSFTGTYFTVKKDIGFESDIFQFESDGSFRYVFFTCTGTGLGKGKYEIIEGDSLRLKFIDCIDCDNPMELSTSSDSSRNIEIDIEIRSWEDDNTIGGVNAFFTYTTIGTTSDINGKIRLSVPKFSEDKTLRLQFIGYDPVDIEIKKEYSIVKGIVRLTFHWVYNQDEVKTYKILSWTNSKLKLRRYPYLTITYDKVATTKTDKLIEDRMGEVGFKLYKEKICTTR